MGRRPTAILLFLLLSCFLEEEEGSQRDCPLASFHHVPWQHQLSSGRTLWEELSFRYDRGVAYVDGMAETWKSLEGNVDSATHHAVMAKLEKERAYARHWRQTCLEYFSGFSDACEYPSGVERIAD